MPRPTWGPSPERITNDKLNAMLDYAEEVAGSGTPGDGSDGGTVAPATTTTPGTVVLASEAADPDKPEVVCDNDTRLTPFGASGSNHKEGLVPDPGASAGTTRYLREDGWHVPETSSDGGGYEPGTATVSGPPSTFTMSGAQDGPVNSTWVDAGIPLHNGAPVYRNAANSRIALRRENSQWAIYIGNTGGNSYILGGIRYINESPKLTLPLTSDSEWLNALDSGVSQPPTVTAAPGADIEVNLFDGLFKPSVCSTASAPVGTLFQNAANGHLCFKMPDGTVRDLTP